MNYMNVWPRTPNNSYYGQSAASRICIPHRKLLKFELEGALLSLRSYIRSEVLID